VISVVSDDDDEERGDEGWMMLVKMGMRLG